MLHTFPNNVNINTNLLKLYKRQRSELYIDEVFLKKKNENISFNYASMSNKLVVNNYAEY